FIKAFEEEYYETTTSPVALAAAPAGGGEDTGKADEQTESDVVLESAGNAKCCVIKVVRALTSLSLKDAKDLVDGAPKPVLEGVDKAAADAAKETLEGAGATVTLK